MRREEPIAGLLDRRILLAGAGYVGFPLSERLAVAGAHVLAIRRHRAEFPDGVRLYRADLCAPETLAGLDGPWHAAVFLLSADQFSEAAYRRHYLAGVRNLLDLFETRGETPRVVFVSSTGVYAQTGGQWVDEHAPTEPATFSGRVMLEAEQQVVGAGFTSVILRFGGIYGPGRDRLLRMVARGEARRPSRRVWTNRIHRDDGVAAIVHVLSMEDPPGTLNVVDTEPADLGEILAGLAQRLGVAVPPLDPVADTRDRGGNKRVSSHLLQATGFTFRYPTWREGFGAILAGADN